MKILLTGNKGFIGSHLEKILNPELTLDIKDGQDILDCELPDADVIIHLAAQADVMNSIADPEGDAITNILGTIRLAEHYKNKKFIFASSGGYIQNSITAPYGLSKLCAEKYIKILCKNYVILRLPNIYGPGSRSVVDKFLAAKSSIKIYGDGLASRDYVHVADIVDAIAWAIEWPKGSYSLGSGRNYSVIDLAEATGKKIEYWEKREGELEHSFVPNNTRWKPKVDVLDYIKNNRSYAKA